MIRQTIFTALCAISALWAAPALAQFDDGGYSYDDAGYDDFQLVGYRDSTAELEARNSELKAEVARYRRMLDESTTGNAGGGCDACDGGCGGCCLQPANWFDCCCCGPTLAFSLGGDAWRDYGDLDRSNNFGNRFTLDATWNVGGSGTRANVGMAYGLYDYHGRTTTHLSSAEQQVFLNAGLYHRGCDCGDWSWAVSYDYLNDNHYGVLAESIDLHQIRFLVGRMMNACNEFGVWGAFGIGDDDYGSDYGLNGGVGGKVEVQDQVNLYWRRYWDFGGETMLYAGVAQTNMLPSPVIFDSGWSMNNNNNNNDLTEFVIGLRGIAPLTCNLGLYGGFHYVIPSASGGAAFNPVPIYFGQFPSAVEENWSVGFGLIWVRGCSLPLLPAADNGWMGKRTGVPILGYTA